MKCTQEEKQHGGTKVLPRAADYLTITVARQDFSLPKISQKNMLRLNRRRRHEEKTETPEIT